MKQRCIATRLFLASSVMPLSHAQSQPLTLEFAPISVEQYQVLAKQKPEYAQPELVEISDEAAAYAMLGE